MSAHSRPRHPLPSLVLLFALLTGATPTHAPACDSHSVYIEPEAPPEPRRFSLGIAEQFTHLGTVEQGSEEIPSEGEVLNSSITQLFFGYAFTEWLSAQVNLPIIVRDYRRLQEGRLTPGSVSGVGDMAVIGVVTPFDEETPLGRLTVGLVGGLKLPSGDPSLLAEELQEPTTQAAHAGTNAVQPRHEVGPSHDEPVSPGGVRTESAIHGHDLALGSGSVDGIVGGQMSWRKGRTFAFGFLQYAVRSEGSFRYTYANELTWSGGPGYDVLSTDTWNLGLQAVVSGATKGQDTQAGVRLNDTARTTLYAGPGLTFDWSGGLAAQLSVDIPVVRNATSVQIVPDVRVRGGLIWRF